MKFIGITGGVGAGKSFILSFLEENYNAIVVRADDLAKSLMAPGSTCHEQLEAAFGDDGVFDEAHEIRPEVLAKLIYEHPARREELNAIVHPAVKEEVLRQVKVAKYAGKVDYFFLEAALLIEEHYDELCDELWYIYADESVRRERLRASRGYSDEKIDAMLASQLSEEIFREMCRVVIDNNGDEAHSMEQIRHILGPGRKDYKKEEELEQAEDSVQEAEEKNMQSQKPEDYVFGLDIGTRNVVGTVGYPTEKGFCVMAQCTMEHETRAMLDGQIHDIGRVAKTIAEVKENLESQIGFTLTDVCIAAAGRVLRTITTRIDYEYPEETVVTGEDLNTLDLLGVDKAQAELSGGSEHEKYKFYCVGYTVMKYYLNDEPFSSLEGHKAEKISEDIIVTFLPEDVVDGLYSAVERADLHVANMTLEPIAAMNVAIPPAYRMLNIALVDVGAGTSDICLTKDGSIIAYGMIPYAGDELTEVLVQAFLVDFATAEQIKKDSVVMEEVTYKDIMGIEHTVPAEEVWKLTDPVMEKITSAVAEKIKELNGDASVAASFVVGGGGKVHGFTDTLADELDIVHERVALRGEEVMQNIDFLQQDIKKDPLLVTPIGICLNYYESKNNFIMIRFNGELMKLYDNGHMKIVDAALQAGIPTEQLFPQRGREIHYKVNGTPRMVRGLEGESAHVTMNGEEVGLNTRLEPNSTVEVEYSTVGAQAELQIQNLEEFANNYVSFTVNGQRIRCPKFVEVNGSLEPGSYIIKEGDDIETRNFYTVGQLASFMDVEVDMNHEIVVNNRSSDLNTLIYENFTIDWVVTGYGATEAIQPSDEMHEVTAEVPEEVADAEPVTEEAATEEVVTEPEDEESFEERKEEAIISEAVMKAEAAGETYDHNAFTVVDRPNTPFTVAPNLDIKTKIRLTVNGKTIEMNDKKDYIFVDVFNFIDFDVHERGHKGVLTQINGHDCGYADPLKDGDVVDIRWKD
jgi:dephospho-CoA kinase/cell division protein FtsA